MCEVDQDQTGTRGVGLLFLFSPFWLHCDIEDENSNVVIKKKFILLKNIFHN
jgi:hypothetical protein